MSSTTRRRNLKIVVSGEPEALVTEARVPLEPRETGGCSLDLRGFQLHDVLGGVQHAELYAAVIFSALVPAFSLPVAKPFSLKVSAAAAAWVFSGQVGGKRSPMGKTVLLDGFSDSWSFWVGVSVAVSSSSP